MKEQKAKQQDGFSKEQTIGQETQAPSKEKDIER